jgi:hypothetical protein
MPTRTAAPPALIEALREGGIVAPRTTIREARRAGLRLELACALLEKESSGGRNIYGHDESIFKGAGKVTRENYARYKRQRVASRNRSMQGVGPCQLTWWELQDSADAQGGCWRPEINMRTGFSHLAALTKQYGESDGARRYNGSGADAEAYSRDLVARARKWEAIIDRGDDPPKGRRKRFARPEKRDEARRDAPGKRAASKSGAGAAADEARGPAAPARPRIEALAAAVRERDAEAGEAWKRLVAFGHRRRRGLHAEKAAKQARGDQDDSMTALLEALGRIEGRLSTLVEVTIHEPEVPVADTAAAAAA